MEVGLVILGDGLDLFHHIECDAPSPTQRGIRFNIRWQAEMAPMMAIAHDFSGESSDRLPLIFQL